MKNAAARRRYEKDPEQVREYRRMLYHRPETIDKTRKAIRKRNRERLLDPVNREKSRETQREYNNRPEVKARRKRMWRKSAEYRRKSKLYKAHRKPWDDTVTVDAIESMLDDQDGKCVYCKVDIRDNFTMDHIYPESKGGPSTVANLQLLCISCNSRKRNTVDWQYTPIR